MEPRAIRLTVMQPSLAPAKITTRGPVVTLGRAVECTIPIRDRYLSRKHAEIFADGSAWSVRDCGSVNGTLLNGSRLEGPVRLRVGDRITLGDTHVVFEDEETSHSQLIALDSDSQARKLAIPLNVAVDSSARTNILASLALQFIEDRSMGQLFDFILDRVVDLLQPSRAALALLASDGQAFDNVMLRRSDQNDSMDLFISRTLLGEVIDGRNVVSFVDTTQEGKLAQAKSIVGQKIRSAVCAPLLVGDAVLGVLYLDFLVNHRTVRQEDVELVAQIARFAAVKLENTRLREESIAKARLDEELRTAWAIQRRLLPEQLPAAEGYEFAGRNKPVRTVSGDYYDLVVRPDGRIYFIMADVSGKGITAALVMASVATAFNIFIRTDPTPADLVRELNATLAPKTAPTKFVTMVVGVLDPRMGKVEFANAGHVPPLLVKDSGVEALTSTDIVVGLFEEATYRNQRAVIGPGETLVLFTDGVTEAENDQDEQLGLEAVAALLASLRGSSPCGMLDTLETHIQTFVGGAPVVDDVTMMALTRR